MKKNSADSSSSTAFGGASAASRNSTSSHTTLAIIGSGPAAYTAALYAARARLAPTVLGGEKSGGQLMYTTDVENYPGFPEGVRGPELMMSLRKQAERFEATVIDKYVTAVDFSQRPFRLWTERPSGFEPTIFERGSAEDLAKLASQVKQKEPSFTADSVIITTGAASIMLGVPGESEFLSRGVSTCAVCDAAFFRDKTTFVIGGGDSAMEDSLALSRFAKSVTIIHRRDQFRASKIMQERVLGQDNVSVLWNTQLKEVIGDKKVEKISIETDGKTKELPADGVFIAIGHRPMTQIFKNLLQLDDHGYIVTRQSATEAGVKLAKQALDKDGLVSFPTMTSVEGVFAAGDNVDVRYKQAVTAAGQGCSAALDAERWLSSQGGYDG